MASIAEKKAKVEAQIQETRKQIQLSEGQNKAFYEEAETEKKRNRERVKEIRDEIKELHFKLSETARGSERAVEDILQKKRKERSGGSSGGPSSTSRVTHSGHTIKMCEYRLHDHVKRLNFLQYKANEKEVRLAHLQQQLKEEGPTRAKEQQSLIDQLKKEHESLENELERILVQVIQSEGVKRRYATMVTSLKGDAASYRTNIEILQQKLSHERDILRDLKESRVMAERTRDGLRRVLHREEDRAFESRRDRDRKLDELKKKVEEKSVREASPLSQRKLSLLRTPTQRLSPTPDQDSDPRPAAKINQEMDKFTRLFSKLKETVGVTSMEEVVERLVSQRDTREHLHQLRDNTLQELDSLRKEKESLQQQLHRVKYAITEDSARLDGAFGELETKWDEQMERKQTLEDELKEDLKVLLGAEATFECMAEALRADSPLPEVLKSSPRNEVENNTPESRENYSDHFLARLLCLKEFCLQESDKCWRFVKDKQLSLTQKKEEDTFGPERSTSLGEKEIQTCIPGENVRILFPSEKEAKQSGPQVDEGLDSGEEEEAIARRFIKRQAQMVVEARSRRKNRPVSTFRS